MSGKRAKVAKRQRNSFFFYVSNVLGCYQLGVGYKNTKGTVSPLSITRQGASIKAPFGHLRSCEHRVKNISPEEPGGEFKFLNTKMQSTCFPVTLLNNLEFKECDFGRKVTAFYVEKRLNVLALYLSLMNKAEGFIDHDDEAHDKHGLKRDGGDSLEALGGTVAEFQDFLKAAMESAIMGESPRKCLLKQLQIAKPNIKRKESDENQVKAPKLLKFEEIEKKEREELDDPNGLEKEYRGCFMGVAHIPLKNISISKEMEVKINPFRVQYIKTSIRKRYDPSLSVLVVCPVDENSSNAQINSDGNFFVVQKVQCFKAFQELDQEGEFVGLQGHHTGKVLCYVLKTNRRDIMEYGSLRENSISADFARKTLPQDLLHHFKSLTMADSSVDAVKVVQRMSRLCRIGPEECTALDRFCKWSKDGFNALMLTIDKYEKYQTLDTRTEKNQRSIARGDKMAIQHGLFKLLAKCTEEFFLSRYEQVLKAEISLKDVAEEYKLIMGVEKVYTALEVIAQEKVEDIKKKNPGKFDFERMKVFLGASVVKNKKNEKAQQLQDYYTIMSSSSEVEYESPVQMKPLDHPSAVFGSEDVVKNTDMLIYIMKDKNVDTIGAISFIINCVVGGEKIFHAALLLFPSEADYFETVCYLRSQQAATSQIPGFKLFPLIFRKETSCTGVIVENVSYALLFGKFCILDSSLVVLYDNIQQLSNVVKSICPKKGTVGLVCDKGVPMIKIHSPDVDIKVTYYGDPKEISKFEKKLSSDKSPIMESMSEVSATENIPSTSTTPLKEHCSLDDSGFVRDSIEFSPVVLKGGSHKMGGCSSAAVRSLNDFPLENV